MEYQITLISTTQPYTLFYIYYATCSFSSLQLPLQPVYCNVLRYNVIVKPCFCRFPTILHNMLYIGSIVLFDCKICKVFISKFRNNNLHFFSFWRSMSASCGFEVDCADLYMHLLRESKLSQLHLSVQE